MSIRSILGKAVALVLAWTIILLPPMTY